MAEWVWSLVVLAVLVLGVVVLLRSRNRGTNAMATVRQGAGVSRMDSSLPKAYSPKNVGNDASARPWEEEAIAPQLEAVTAADSGLGLWVPSGFDADAFISASKANFLSLQEAWDRSDVASLRAMMTDDMLQQIQTQLAERERSHPGAVSRTDVLMLDAQLLGVEDHDQAYVASVEFSGMSRESGAAGPSPFREIWSITRPKSSQGGWLVAGVQALQ